MYRYKKEQRVTTGDQINTYYSGWTTKIYVECSDKKMWQRVIFT